MKLTETSVKALELPPGKAEQIFWDDTLPGFGVRVRRNLKTWRLQFRCNGRQHSESLGDVRRVSLEDARRIARVRFGEIAAGRDPGAERAAARAAQAAEKLTLGYVIEQYLAARETAFANGALAASTLRSTKRHLRNYWRPLHKIQVDQIKRVQVAGYLREFTSQHGAMAARTAKKALSALYSWAAREGLTEGMNPVIGTNDPGAGSRPRDRILSDDELRIIWKVASELDDDFSKVVRLCLWSLCRREEIGGLRWEEINLETGQLILPATRTKSRRVHEIVLPEAALEILRKQPRIEGRLYVFGRRGIGLGGWSYGKNRFEKLVAEAAGRALPRWTLHDLRRTGASRIGEIAPPHVVSALLNHAKPTLVQTYNLATYRTEMRTALAHWAELLAAIVENRDPRVLSFAQRA